MYRTIAPLVAAGFLAPSIAQAAIVPSLLVEPTDIINTGGGVVSAVHFQSAAGGGDSDPMPLLINGIAHTWGTASDANLTINTTFEGDFRNGASGLPQDGSSLIQVLLSGIAGANGITMSVDGLSIGTTYLFQVYWEGNNNHTLTMDIEGTTLNGLADLSSDGATDPDGGTLISYQFVAGDTVLNAFFDRDDPDANTGDQNNWLSGYSLQVVPEPSSLALIALGGLLIARRRRK